MIPKVCHYNNSLFKFIADSAFACADGWLQNGSNCFLFSHNQVTWAEAGAICKMFNAKLAEPSTQEVDSFLSGESIAKGRKYWIGGSDIAIEGRWIWMSNFQPFVYTHWRPGDPSNYGTGEECLLINWEGKGAWVDLECEIKNYYICQRELPEVPQASVIG